MPCVEEEPFANSSNCAVDKSLTTWDLLSNALLEAVVLCGGFGGGQSSFDSCFPLEVAVGTCGI